MVEPPMLENTGTTDRVRRTVDLDAAPAAVWRALTEGGQLSAWFGADVEIDAHPGGQLLVRGPHGRRRAVVVDVEPERSLAFRWLPEYHPVGFVWMPDDTPAGESGEVVVTLTAIAAGTRLTVSELAPVQSARRGSKAVALPGSARRA